MSKFYDTLIGEYIKNPGQQGLSLDNLAQKYFDYRMISYSDITQKGSLNFSEVALDDASKYSAEDVYITAQIYKIQSDEKTINDKVLFDIEMPLLEVLKDMELSGVKIDIKKLEEIGKILEIEIKKEQTQIFKIAGEEFNINSPKQVGILLFEKMLLPTGKKTKTGYSVDNEVLKFLSFKYRIAKHILLFRQYSKLLSTYVDGLLKIIDKKTSLIHTSYNQTVTSTGRLSSTNPNLQNIPSSSDGISGELRKAFIPYCDDDLIVTFDYSQIEVRLLAIMSGDENLLGAFQNGVDIHANTGYFLFGKDELSIDERRIAKSVNFGVIYGISPFGLSKMIGVSQSEAREYINKFYEKYPYVLTFFDTTIRNCEKNGYIETMFDRKRYIKNISDSNSIIKASAQREAKNMPIQGTAADIIKLSMIKIHNFLIEKGLKTKMIMQVHDELVFNVPKNEFELVSQEIKNIMENIITSPIKLIVDMGRGKNWKETK